MQAKPIIRPELSPFDKILEVAGWSIFLLLWTSVVWGYSSLPGIIPIHYNASGEPDRFGDKGAIFILAALATIIFIGFTILNRFPHKFNYIVPITEENAAAQYAFATRMMRYLKFAIGLIFLIITVSTMRTALGKSAGLPPWFLPLLFVLFLGPALTYLIKSFTFGWKR